MDFLQKLREEPVATAMSAKAVCVTEDTSMRDVILQLREQRTGAALVCREGRLVGIFTERDVLKQLAQGFSLSSPVGKSMASELVTVQKTDSLAVGIRRMSVGGFRQLPVVDAQGTPQGMLKVRGIVHFLVEHFPGAVYNLPPEPQLQGQEGA